MYGGASSQQQEMNMMEHTLGQTYIPSPSAQSPEPMNQAKLKNFKIVPTQNKDFDSNYGTVGAY